MRAISIFCLFLMSSLSLWATNFEGGETVEINEVRQGDQYIAGGKIYINAAIMGDLVLAGGEVSIQDSISEDATLAGGQLTINGPIGDDLRAAGGEIILSSNVIGDVVVAGGSVTIQEGVTIYGDLLVTGGKVIVHGRVMGKTKLYGGEMKWHGEASKGMEIRGAELELGGIIRGSSSIAVQKLDILDGASIYGDLSYWQKDGEADFGTSVKSGSVVYDESLQAQWSDASGFSTRSFWPIFTASGLLVIALLTIVLFPTLRENEEFPEENVGKKFILGLVYFVGVPILTILIMATVIGIPIGLFLLVFYLFSIAVVKSLSAVIIAFDLRSRQDRDWSSGMMIVVGLVIFVLLQIISWIPIVGWPIIAVVALYSYGTLIQLLDSRRKRKPMSEEFA